MSKKIVQLNEEVIKGKLKELVRGSVEETLNGLLDAEAERLTQAARYERSEERQGYRSGHYSRNLTTTAGEVKLQVPRLKGISFETAIIERYRRRESSVEEALMEMYLIAVNEDGYREVLGAAEGMKEDKASWVEFFKWLRKRRLDGVKLIVGDKCMGMLEAVGEVFPEANYQRCVVHFYRNVFSVVPKSKVKNVALMLKAIHAQENKAARRKAADVIEELHTMKLQGAAKKVEDNVEETLTYMSFPTEHWSKIRTNNVIERMNREIRRRTRVVGTFPDGNSALMLVCARLRHVAGTQWGGKKYMSMKHFETMEESTAV